MANFAIQGKVSLESRGRFIEIGKTNHFRLETQSACMVLLPKFPLLWPEDQSSSIPCNTIRLYGNKEKA